MGILTLAAYKPVPATPGDANQIANGFTAIEGSVNAVSQAQMAAGNKVTASALSGGPPASPTDGDIWIALAVDANGTEWQFRYNAGSGSSFKWEFIGGSALATGVVGSISTSSTVYVDLTSGPTLTIPRAGDYWVEMGIFGQNNAFTGAYNLDAQVLFSTSGAGQQWDVFVATALFAGGRAVAKEKRTGLAAGETCKIQVLGSSAHTSIFNRAILEVVPVRIS